MEIFLPQEARSKKFCFIWNPMSEIVWLFKVSALNHLIFNEEENLTPVTSKSFLQVPFEQLPPVASMLSSFPLSGWFVDVELPCSWSLFKTWWERVYCRCSTWLMLMIWKKWSNVAMDSLLQVSPQNWQSLWWGSAFWTHLPDEFIALPQIHYIIPLLQRSFLPKCPQVPFAPVPRSSFLSASSIR